MAKREVAGAALDAADYEKGAKDGEQHIVADNVASMDADMGADKKFFVRQRVSQVGRPGGWSRGLVNWVQTFSTRSLPDLRVF